MKSPETSPREPQDSADLESDDPGHGWATQAEIVLATLAEQSKSAAFQRRRQEQFFIDEMCKATRAQSEIGPGTAA